jgi:hypothetical protein
MQYLRIDDALRIRRLGARIYADNPQPPPYESFRLAPHVNASSHHYSKERVDARLKQRIEMATQIYSGENENAGMGRISMRKTQLICFCCSGPVGLGQVDCSCGSEVIFENKPLSKDFTEFDQLMRLLLGKNYKRKVAAH